MRKKLLALVLVAAMVLSLVACGKPTAAPATNTPTPVPTDEPAPTKAPVPAVEGGEASIDFEDGKCGFAAVFEGGRLADLSKISVVDYKGSKVLFAENKLTKPEAYIGFDLDALLGDKIANVKTIKYDVGVGTDTFYSISGVTTLVAGENADQKTNADWSVYMANKSPKTVTVNVKNAFVAGAKNYMVIQKTTDAPYEDANHDKKTSEIGVSFFVDNIKFLDKDGKLIEVNKDAVVSADALFNQKADTKVLYGRKCINDATYPGDWTIGKVIPAEFFAGATGPVNVILDVVIADSPDYANFFAADASWGKPTPDYFIGLGLESTGYVHIQESDGALIVDDYGLKQIGFTITAEAAKHYAENGGMGFPGHNVQVLSATVSQDTYTCVNDSTYPGDWTIGKVIPAEFFAGATGPVNVTLDVVVADSPDYANFFAADASWGKPTPDYFVGLGLESTGYVHVQESDGALIVDDYGLKQITFTITADAAKHYAENGGMGFPGHNVQVLSATVSQNVLHCINDATYPGDWTIGKVIPAEFFAGVTEPVTVTLDVVIADSPDYANFFAADASWGKPTPDYFVGLGLESTGYIHVQESDGALIVDDYGLKQISFTLTADAAKHYAENGGMGFPGHNVQVLSATVTKSIYSCNNDATYPGDWTIGKVIPAGFFADATAPVTVTLNVVIADSPDYANFFAADASWGKPTPDYFVGLGLESTGYVHVQESDGALIVDDYGLKQITFTITAEAAKHYAENGGMGFPGHNVQVLNAVVTR